MIGVDIVKDKATKEHGAAERDKLVKRAFEHGVLFLGCSPSSIRLCPAAGSHKSGGPTSLPMCWKNASKRSASRSEFGTQK
jgi:hypothetical protein